MESATHEPSTDHRVPDPYRTIFRPEAIERHLRGGRQAAVPRFAVPRVAVVLWLLLGLLGLAGVAVSLIPVPVHASGPAVVSSGGVASDMGEEMVALVFLPATERDRLHAGDTVTLHLGAEADPIRRTILVVEPEAVLPAEAQQRFALPPGVAQTLTVPSVVAVVGLEPLPADSPALSLPGSAGRADVEIGSRRAGSFLPVVGRFFGEGA
jgi:hypothetical protein